MELVLLLASALYPIPRTSCVEIEGLRNDSIDRDVQVPARVEKSHSLTSLCSFQVIEATVVMLDTYPASFGHSGVPKIRNCGIFDGNMDRRTSSVFGRLVRRECMASFGGTVSDDSILFFRLGKDMFDR
ncbi:hypothetical protein QCA50_004998 [Cerrena zonata]|uniref:Secreted protein n=1 Tax=Cerrena zonata TaxID=2478898 RepID=A0AAW0GPU1_9APHY